MNSFPFTTWKLQFLKPGHNCWRIEPSGSVAFLIDAEAYFAALRRTIGNARRSICIVGWDFNADLPLGIPGLAPRLGELIRRRVEEEPGLRVRILVWGMGPLFGSRSIVPYLMQEWRNHPRIRLRYAMHPGLRGSHHQKMVTIDDSVAFVGGMDLTAGRWDRSCHRPHSPERCKPNGDSYGPVHDVQLMLSGRAAVAIARLCRQRWQEATGEKIAGEAVRHAWPAEIAPELKSCQVAIARTFPGRPGRKGCSETFRLTLDTIAEARRHIYIETQYLACFEIAEALSRRLEEPTGPEIVILVTRSSRGVIEQFAMACNRNRIIRRMLRSDRHGRLRVLYPVTTDETGREREVLIHSKLLIADDRILRIGSSNLNNRSKGFDTECDVAIVAGNLQEREAIFRLRARLLAEHLQVSEPAMAARLRHRSMIATIDLLNHRPRGLRGFTVSLHGSISPLPGTKLIDPSSPLMAWQELRAFLGNAIAWIRRNGPARRASRHSRS